MYLFAFATLLPTTCLSLAALVGGPLVWTGLIVMSAGCYAVDRLAHGQAARRIGSEFPTGDALLTALGLLHLPMLTLAVWAISSAPYLIFPERIGLLIGFGLFFGQIGHPNAHELIHRPNRGLRALGVMTYATLLIGHHASAHRLVHHVHVGTAADPNSAPQGTGFWRFFAKAWRGSFVAGLRAEKALRRRAKHPAKNHNPYFIYLFWSLTSLGLSWAVGGAAGIGVVVAVAVYAQIQIFLADYVQHYGLRRALKPDGKPQPVGPQDSWNSPHLGSSAMMLNAPRHSDHHMHPGRHFPALRLDAEMPVLPYSLPVMAVIALIPPLWRRMMDPRVKAIKTV
ncbi:alkane 1-monooxygenase [Thalassovita sp.]|uniref:alkane 1-monooxygenase n=1 Tax=Thalassovita sp. TaxID=1979401 RepID=UPI003B59EEE2